MGRLVRDGGSGRREALSGAPLLPGRPLSSSSLSSARSPKRLHGPYPSPLRSHRSYKTLLLAGSHKVQLLHPPNGCAIIACSDKALAWAKRARAAAEEKE